MTRADIVSGILQSVLNDTLSGATEEKRLVRDSLSDSQMERLVDCLALGLMNYPDIRIIVKRGVL